MLASFGRAGQLLFDMARLRRFSPSYLFEGEDATVLLEAAECFAACVLAPSLADDSADRLRDRIARRVHPDVHHIERDKATVISMDALGKHLEQAMMSPREASRQVFLVQPADAIEARAMGRYLKALEEPPSTTIFVLLTARPERLPDTVLSRCRRIRFAPRSPESIAGVLLADGTVSAEASALIAHVSSGSLGRARRLAAMGALPLAQQIARVASSSSADLMGASAAWWSEVTAAATAFRETEEGATMTAAVAQRAVVAEILRVLQVGARDAMVKAPASRDPLESLCSLVSLDNILGWHDDLLALLGATHHNGTPLIMLTEAARRLRQRVLAEPQSG